MDIGRVGVWARTDGLSLDEAAEFARGIEALGFGALWIPDAFGRDPLVHAGWLLAQTRRLVVATGIVNIHLRDAIATAGAARTLHEQSGGRFLLGLGVSHEPAMTAILGRPYPKPLAAMRAYLDALAAAPWTGPALAGEPPIVLAALGPRMLALAGERTRGAHPYFAPPENTARSRALLGPAAWLCPEQKCLLEAEPTRARKRARAAIAGSLALPNYRKNLERVGFGAEDFEQGGSDRLVDATVAWGDVEALARAVEAHHAAGATHVCIQALDPEHPTRPHRATLEAMAARLLGGASAPRDRSVQRD
ncbi:MAG: TIGR03620 family F420-dependent LLM class oxidoreductase [Myxococcota bacterium]